MPHYSLYHLNPQDGHIERIEPLYAADDVSAAYFVQHEKGRAPAELWRAGRKILRIDGPPNVFQIHLAEREAQIAGERWVIETPRSGVANRPAPVSPRAQGATTSQPVA